MSLNTKIYEEQKLCLDECYDNQFEYNEKCYDDCPTGTYKLFLNRNICVSEVPENYYLDEDDIFRKCYSTCKNCSKGGNETNHNCNDCIFNYIFLNESFVSSQNCYIKCDNFYYFSEGGEYACTSSDSCPTHYNKLINPRNKCIDDCKNDTYYQYEYKNNCSKECPENTKIYEKEKLCLHECYDNQFEYNEKCYDDCPNDTYRFFYNKNICVESIQENYYLDDQDKIYKECYSLCKKCSQSGDVTNNNCDECINNYRFLDDPSATSNNCYQNCSYNYYFNEEGQYACGTSNSCPTKYSKLIVSRNKCIDNCKNDNKYIYEYNNECFEICPEGKKLYESQNLCLDECYDNQFEYNEKCYDDCPTGTYKLFQNRNICVIKVPENYYLDNDDIYKECYNICKKCSKAGNETYHYCSECINDFSFLNDTFAFPNNCYENCQYYYYFNEYGQYTCTNSDSCPLEFNKLIESKNKCIDYCKNDVEYIYENNDKCLKECPENLKIDIEEKKCVESCNEKQLEYNNACYSENSNENNNIFINKNIFISNDTNFDAILNNIIISQYLPEKGGSITIETDDGITQVTNSKTELELLKNLSNTVLNISIIDLGECESILKRVYNINENDSLIFVKSEEKSGIASQKNIKYEILEPYNKTKLNLSVCEESPINLIIPMDISEETKQLYEQMKESGYNMFDINDAFYQDICTPFDSENGTDILLSDRINYIYDNENTQCQPNCQFSYYSVESKYMNCSCSTSEESTNNENNVKKEDFTAKKLYESFYDVLKYSNYDIMKCFNIVSDGNRIIKNIGSFIVIIYFLFYLGCLGIYIYNGISPLKTKFKYDIKEVIEKNNLNLKLDIENVLNPPIKRKSKLVLREDVKKEREKKTQMRKSNVVSHNIINDNILIYSNMASSKGTLDEFQNEKKTELKIKEEYKPHNLFSSKDILDISQNDKNIESQIDEENNYNNIISIKDMHEQPPKEKKSELKEKEKYLTSGQYKEIEGSPKKVDYNDFELNGLEYNEAIELDKRTLLQLYWATLKREHLLIFTFINCDDYNILSVKLTRFIFLVTTDMALNVFFFSDDSMHKLFINYGKYDFFQQIPQITYSTIITQLMELLLYYLSLTDKPFHYIKSNLMKGNMKQIPKIIRCMKIKLIIYFSIIGILFVVYWYIISVFCGVYRNTQIHFIKDSVISFSISLAYPFALYLLSTGLRICSLRDSKLKRFKCIYKISNIIPFF